MNPLIQFKKSAALFLIPLVWLQLFSNAQAVVPPPDGGYPGGNTAEGHNALFSLTTGSGNTAVGSAALFDDTTGDLNAAIGFAALTNDTTGSNNTATGGQALKSNTIGRDNTATGFNALRFNTTGDFNIGLGASAGVHLTTGDNNIDIGNPGVAAESNTIRIGQEGKQTATFIAGIHGETITGSAVFINSAGRLGTIPSSQRFKDNIRPMGELSEALFALEPVTFHYKKELDAVGGSQFGLVAEEVEKVNPDLVVKDKDGKPYSVRYDQVNAMLLNEFLKAHSKMEEQEATIAQLKKELQATAAHQQKQIEALITGLQKVSAQLAAASPSRGGLEASKFATGRIRRGGPAPQMVNNP